MIDKINNSIKIIEKSLIDEHSDYEYGLLVGEHDTLISILDAIHYPHKYAYIDNHD